jgi:hypothetical protein
MGYAITYQSPITIVAGMAKLSLSSRSTAISHHYDRVLPFRIFTLVLFLNLLWSFCLKLCLHSSESGIDCGSFPFKSQGNSAGCISPDKMNSATDARSAMPGAGNLHESVQ